MFLLAGLLNHGLHHHGSLLITFNLATIGELLHRLYHLHLLVAHGFWGITARAGAGAGAGVGTGAGAGAGTTRRWLWSGPTRPIVILVLLGMTGRWGGIFGIGA